MQVELGSVDLGARTVKAWLVEAGLGEREGMDVVPGETGCIAEGPRR